MQCSQPISLDPFVMKLIESGWFCLGASTSHCHVHNMSHDQGFKMSMSPRTRSLGVISCCMQQTV